MAHVAFGTVLGPNGRPFKTRSGGTVKLTDLLDAAVTKARSIVAEKAHGLSEAELDQIAEHAGIGAVKYADLSTSRTKDYSFDVERMVSFSGNTGVYLQYAHTRICSVLHKAGDGPITVDPTRPLHPAERALALTLDGFGDVVAEVGRLLEPHRLCVVSIHLCHERRGELDVGRDPRCDAAWKMEGKYSVNLFVATVRLGR